MINQLNIPFAIQFFFSCRNLQKSSLNTKGIKSLKFWKGFSILYLSVHFVRALVFYYFRGVWEKM